MVAVIPLCVSAKHDCNVLEPCCARRQVRVLGGTVGLVFLVAARNAKHGRVHLAVMVDELLNGGQDALEIGVGKAAAHLVADVVHLAEVAQEDG